MSFLQAEERAAFQTIPTGLRQGWATKPPLFKQPSLEFPFKRAVPVSFNELCPTVGFR